MATGRTVTYQQVLSRAKDLTPREKLHLLETLIAQVRRDLAPRKRHRVAEFRGVSHTGWDGTDVQEYVNRERDAWDRWRT